MTQHELRDARRKLGFRTQADIAKRLGTRQPTISFWESQPDGSPAARLYRELLAAWSELADKKISG